MRGEDTRERIGTENMVEETRQYQRNWKTQVESTTLGCLTWQAYSSIGGKMRPRTT
jgi:hypothetical protein